MTTPTIGAQLGQRAFDLLAGLAEENSKAWYDAHRAEMKAELLEPFAAMLESVTAALEDAAVPLRGGSRTMFRMNRDVRFSADKRPYRESVAGLLTPSGTKAESDGVVYVELNLAGGWAGGGFYQLPTPELNVLRRHIVSHPDDWQRVKAETADRGAAWMTDERLKRMPRGFEDHASSDLAHDLRLKNLVVRSDLSIPAWLDGSIAGRVAAVALACMPLLAFGSAARA